MMVIAYVCALGFFAFMLWAYCLAELWDFIRDCLDGETGS